MAAVGNMHPSLHFNNRSQSRGFCDGRIVGELLVMMYQFKMSHDGSTDVVEHSAGLAGGRVLMRGPGHPAREGLDSPVWRPHQTRISSYWALTNHWPIFYPNPLDASGHICSNTEAQ